jgi:TolB protein
MSTPASHLFMSYSREDKQLQRQVIAGLRERGVVVWVDVENLIPGSPAWEREIERAIRSAAAVVVLLSPDSNNSEWVRREISFAEQNNKRILPVLIRGDEDDSIPLRLSSHQRVDLRRNLDEGLDELARALNNQMGIAAVPKRPKQPQKTNFDPAIFRKIALPALLTLFVLLCLGGLGLGAAYIIGNTANKTGTATLQEIAETGTVETEITQTAIDIVTEVTADLLQPGGRIVYTCQVAGDEICILNPDGSGWKRLTDTTLASYNASLSPDGTSVVYVSGQGDKSEIFELHLDTLDRSQLTELGEYVSTPEISPDDRHILFTYREGDNNRQIWIMDRDGTNPRPLYRYSGRDAHDATWSPDGSKILFAFGRADNNQLYIMDRNGQDPQLLNDTVDTRGHSSWSVHDQITLDMGGTFMHEIYSMNADGSDLRQISEPGFNSQGESFSPDGEWIVYSGYTDVVNKNTGSCEIYIMRADGSDIRRLTENHYCDYQPRWGK